MRNNGMIRTTAGYPWGEPCSATLALDELVGLSTRALISKVLREPQTTVQARRTARLLEESLASRRVLDVERYLGAFPDDDAPGEPVGIDEPVLGINGSAAAPEQLHLRAAEHYVGG